MSSEDLRDAIKQARSAVEDCFEALTGVWPDDTQAELYRHLDDATISLSSALALTQTEAP